MPPRLSTPRWWQWPTILSLDAPLVALAWQGAFAGVARVALHWPHYAVLGVSVWLAYAADRWLEAWRLPPEAIVTPRHRFYADHRRPVAVVWLALLAGDVAVAFICLSLRELLAGGLLLLPVLAYVLSHQSLHRDRLAHVPKEVLTALLIAGGASVFVLAAGRGSGPLYASVGLFAALCFVNVALIGFWEREVDAVHGQSSLARQTAAGSAVFHLLPWALTAVAAFVAIPVLRIPDAVAHCVAASAVLLALIDRFEPRLGWPLARVLADAALLTPLLPLARGLS